jgi:hypothetical protein
MKRIAMAVVIAAICAFSARGQSFQNLDFESAYGLPGNPGSGELVSVMDALPGWTAYAGPPSDGDTFSSITYESNSLPSSPTLVTLASGSFALSGQYSVWLFIAGSITQTGLVPDNAGFLQFEASIAPAVDEQLSVSLGGEGLSFSAISEGPNDSTVYEAAIPAAMDGQVETLTFGINTDDTALDNIQFMPVPKPSEYVLMGVGASVLGLCIRRKQTEC